MTDIIGPADAPNFTTWRPADDRSIGSTDTWMKDCTGPKANDGTKVKAAWLNAVIGQFQSLIRGNGNTGGGSPVVTEDNADDMALRAVQHLIQRGQTLYGADSGSANALVVSLTPALAEYKAGLTLRIKAANANTGATTLNVNALGAKSVVRRDGSILRDSDIISGAVQDYIYDGTTFQLASAFGRVALARNVDLYVNGGVGNDANDGTANISGKAVATLQKAMDIAFSYPPSQYAITIHIADGTYAPFATPSYGGPNIIVDGNSSTPANVLISTSAAMHCVAVSGPNTLTCKNLTVANSNAGGFCGFVASNGATLSTQNTRSNIISSGSVFEAYGAGANLNVNGNHFFNGGAPNWFWGMLGGLVSIATGITLNAASGIGTTVTANASMGGKISLGPPNASFGGSALTVGSRYSVTSNGVINVNGGGANVFPGTTAGAASSGGQYG
jgi:hypothetical protein